MKDTLVTLIWNFWYDHEVSWEEIYDYISSKDFKKDILKKLSSYVKEK